MKTKGRTQIRAFVALAALSGAQTAYSEGPPPEMAVRFVQMEGTRAILLCHRVGPVDNSGHWQSVCAPISEHRRCVETMTTILCPQPDAPPTPPPRPAVARPERAA